jgi:hypothetical protein
MRVFKTIALFTVAGCSLVACADDTPPTETANVDEIATPVEPAAASIGPHGSPEDPPMLGMQRASDPQPAASDALQPAATGPLMSWHGGGILQYSVIRAIFWGSSFAADKIDGLDSFYTGLAGSAYAGTNTEYGGSNGQVGPDVSYLGHSIDPSAAPRRAPRTSAILAEVCKVITNPDPNGYYPVYISARRGGAGYCAWHSYGTCRGVPVQFGFFFNLDGDPGCDPQDTSGLHSQGLAALANVSGHEYSETVTDPRNGGWWDLSGEENADKCAWSFDGLVTLKNGSQWKIQGNWSNAAYSAGTGYPNRSGQRGCLAGN